MSQNEASNALGRIEMSPNLRNSFQRAAAYAGDQSHRNVTLEHLLLALIEDREAAVILEASAIDVSELMTDVSDYLGRLEDRVDQGSGPEGRHQPLLGPDLRHIIQSAGAAAQKSKRQAVGSALVLAAIVGDGRSPAAQMLRNHGLTFENAVAALKQANAAPHHEVPAASQKPGAAPSNKASPAPAASVQPAVRHTPDAGAADGTSRLQNVQAAHDIIAGARERIAAARTAIAVRDTASQNEQSPAPASASPSTKPAPERQPSVQAHPAPAPSQAARALSPAPVPDAPTPPDKARSRKTAPSTKEHGQPPANVQPPQRRPARDEPKPQVASQDPVHGPGPVHGPVQGSIKGKLLHMPPPAPATPQRPRLPNHPDELRHPPAGRETPAQHRPTEPTKAPHSPTPPSPRQPWSDAVAAAPPARPQPPQKPSQSPPPPSPSIENRPARDRHVSEREIRPEEWQEKRPQQRPGRGTAQPQPVSHVSATRTGLQTGYSAPAVPPIAPDTLTARLPRRMTIGRPATVDIRAPRAGLEAWSGGGHDQRGREHVISKAMAMRLRAPEGGFTIEPASPETQWSEGQSDPLSDDVVSWRWVVTPTHRGRYPLALNVTTRVVGRDGLAAACVLPVKAIPVRISANYGRLFRRAGLWTAVITTGFALGYFGEGLMGMGSSMLASVMR